MQGLVIKIIIQQKHFECEQHGIFIGYVVYVAWIIHVLRLFSYQQKKLNDSFVLAR